MVHHRRHFLRRFDHVAKTVPVRREHELPMAFHTGLDSKAELLQPVPNLQAKAFLTGIDHDGDRRVRTQKMRNLGQRGFKGVKRMLTYDEANRILRPWHAGERRRDPEITPAPQFKIDFRTLAAGDGNPVKAGRACEFDHGSDDLLARGI
ncbi:hypothetical protein [Afipia sp. DC4300-2b1]|uniref:hypothetical protein n=1 Tax=Afipia sp. DC4300-2b1 TaxID=2804672 RepID=UPI003CE9FA15